MHINTKVPYNYYYITVGRATCMVMALKIPEDLVILSTLELKKMGEPVRKLRKKRRPAMVPTSLGEIPHMN